jgi:hypothetical protein
MPSFSSTTSSPGTFVETHQHATTRPSGVIERLVAELDDALLGGRPLRACADLGVPAQRVAPGPPLVHGVLREERDEGVELVPFPSAAIRVEPAIQLLERHGRQPSEPALTLRPRNAEKRKMSPRSFRSLAGAAAIAVLATTVSASAGGGEREQVKLNAADQAAAKATMIRRSDLHPAGGWMGRSLTPDHRAPSCPNFHPKQSDLVVTGSAEAYWSRPGRAVVSVTDVLKTARMVQLDWQRAGTKAAIGCSLTAAGATNVVVSKVAFPNIAPVAGAFRAFYDVTQGGQTLRFVSEFAAIGDGRSELSLGEFALASTPVNALHTDVVRLARVMLSRARA